MAELINCPHCERKLRVPDDLLGCRVKCPTCGNTFTAPAATDKPTSAPPPEEEKEALPATYQGQGLRRRGEPGAAAEEDLPSEGYEDAPRPPHRRRRIDLQPHRGTLILILGILSIVVCGFLGPVAWIMGSNDLKEIRAGRMDPEGEGTTNGGRICGIIGTFLNLVLPVCCGIPLMLFYLFRGGAPQGF